MKTKQQPAAKKKNKKKAKDFELNEALQNLGNRTPYEIQRDQKKNRRRIKGDKILIAYTVFLWVCYFVFDDPFVWASAIGISGLPMLLLLYCSYGWGFVATLGIIYLVCSGIKHSWDNMD